MGIGSEYCAELQGNSLVFGTSPTMDTCLFVLHAFYYIMNISYPQKWKDVFIFIDTMLLGVDDVCRKRVSLQKYYICSTFMNSPVSM